MDIKAVKSRVLLKTGTTSDWNLAAENSNFTPLKGEMCIYTDRIPIYEEDLTNPSYYIPGIKIGDGKTNIRYLPFITDDYISNQQIDEIMMNQ